MRKLVVSMNVTLDGYMSGPGTALDWHFENWTSDMAESLSRELGNADTIILGRITYHAMADYWPSRSDCMSCAREDIAYAEMMNNYTKLVFSKTIIRAEWNNSQVIRHDIGPEIMKLKKGEGKNMIVYGSGRLVKALMRSNLIDEYLLWIHPVLLGDGIPFFNENQKQNLLLIDGKTFDSGVIAMRYCLKS